MGAQLCLTPSADAPRRARAWVMDRLVERSRDDLVGSAVLGISELVTNAVVHVRSPILVSITDQTVALRIEVYDESPHPATLARQVSLGGADDPLPTIGRGLQIVGAVSAVWGVAYEPDGKSVWFEPLADADPEHAPTPPLMRRNGLDVHATPAGASPDEDAGVDADTDTHLAVHLVDVPVQVLAHTRHRFAELRRELTLIALDRDRSSAIADELTRAAMDLDRLRDYFEQSTPLMEQGIREEYDRFDLHFTVSPGDVSAMRKLKQALRDADEYCRQEKLLTLAAGPQEDSIRDWILTEMISQAEGAEPNPWAGDFTVTDPAVPQNAGLA